MEAFVYMWQDKITDKYYIGVHKGSSNDGYVCSSKLMLEEYNERETDFRREILAEGSWDDMFELEGQLLEYFDVKNNRKFYNQHNGGENFFNVDGFPSSKKGKTYKEFYGEEKAIDIKNKLSKASKNKPKSKTHRQRISESKKGKSRDSFSEEWKNNMKKSAQNRYITETKSCLHAPIQVKIDNILYPSLKEASRQLGLDYDKLRYQTKKKLQCQI